MLMALLMEQLGTPVMDSLMDFVVLVSITLMAVDMLMLAMILLMLEKRFSIFRPWRILLIGLMAYCGFLFVSDGWWFLTEVPDVHPFYALRMLLGRFLLSGLVWLFSWAWWRALPRGGLPCG